MKHLKPNHLSKILGGTTGGSGGTGSGGSSGTGGEFSGGGEGSSGSCVEKNCLTGGD